MMTKMRYHFTAIRMATVKKTDYTKSWQGYEKLKLSCSAGANAKWYGNIL